MNKKNKEILVVEVDRLTKTQVKNGLKEKGYKVTTVSSAREAIDFCIKTVVDMVIMELNLPDNDGIYVIQTLRTFNNVLPIIVVSGRTNVESKVLALDAGANDFITKPFSLDELYARIRKEFRYVVQEEKHLLINGTTCNDKPIYDVNDINKETLDEFNAKIGIIAVPAEVAQDIADKMVAAGVEAIWNFAPTKLILPKDIIVSNMDLATSLAVLSHQLYLKKHKKGEE